MTVETLTGLDFTKYEHMIKALDEAAGIVVTGTGGEIIWHSESLQADAISECAKVLCKADPDSEDYLFNLPGNRELQSLPLRNLQQEHLAWLSIVLDQDKHVDVSRQARMALLLKAIENAVVTEYQLCAELDDMASELSERYDELNLVYDTDEYLGDQNVVEKALARLVRNFLEYLNVDVVRLHLPDKNISITSGKQSGLEREKSILRSVTGSLMTTMSLEKQSLVFNSASELAVIRDEYDCKLLGTPLMSPRGQVDGVLIVIKNIDADDFTNSDRNLLEVMSRRATQLMQGSYDTLTGVFNRFGYEQQINQSLITADDHATEHCLLNINLDDFHVVNDSIGFAAGDDVIRKTVRIIRSQVRDNDIVARIGSNEFGVLLQKCPLEFGEKIADKICQRIAGFDFGWEGLPFQMSGSIGLILVANDNENAADLISNAELACEAAKERGKNQVYSFGHNLEDLIQRRDQVSWVGRIRQSLSDNRFVVFAQEIRPLDPNAEEIHCEILLRLRDENDRILSPFAFMPAAERYRLMPDIDRWVITSTFAILEREKQRLMDGNTTVSINLSGQSIGTEGFADFILGEVQRYKIPTEWLCLEVTESAAIDNITVAKDLMNTLKDRGIRFSLDDFGTGLSSFEYLKTLPVNYLKIDGFFIREILHDPVSSAIVTAVNQVGHAMGLKTIAEYVEDEEIMNCLRTMGIDFGQGYGIGKPMPLTDFLDKIPATSRHTAH